MERKGDTRDEGNGYLNDRSLSDELTALPDRGLSEEVAALVGNSVHVEGVILRQ